MSLKRALQTICALCYRSCPGNDPGQSCALVSGTAHTVVVVVVVVVVVHTLTHRKTGSLNRGMRQKSKSGEKKELNDPREIAQKQ